MAFSYAPTVPGYAPGMPMAGVPSPYPPQQGIFGNLFGFLTGRTGSYTMPGAPSPYPPALAPELQRYWVVASNHLGQIGQQQYANNIQVTKSFFSTYPSVSLKIPNTNLKYTFEFISPDTGTWKPMPWYRFFGGKTRRVKQTTSTKQSKAANTKSRRQRKRHTRARRYTKV